MEELKGHNTKETLQIPQNCLLKKIGFVKKSIRLEQETFPYKQQLGILIKK